MKLNLNNIPLKKKKKCETHSFNAKIKKRIKESIEKYECYTFLNKKINSLIVRNMKNEIQIICLFYLYIEKTISNRNTLIQVLVEFLEI